MKVLRGLAMAATIGAMLALGAALGDFASDPSPLGAVGLLVVVAGIGSCLARLYGPQGVQESGPNVSRAVAAPAPAESPPRRPKRRASVVEEAWGAPAEAEHLWASDDEEEAAPTPSRGDERRRRREEAEDRRRAQAEAKEARRREAEERRHAEEERRREAEAEAHREAEAQRRREAEEERRREAEAEAQRQREAEDQQRREAEAQRQREAEEQARREAEVEARRQGEAEAERRRHAEEEQREQPAIAWLEEPEPAAAAPAPAAPAAAVPTPARRQKEPRRSPFGRRGAKTADGRLDLNRAAAHEIAALPGVGPASGERIVEDRRVNGPFADVYDLTRVEGFSEARVRRFADKVSV